MSLKEKKILVTGSNGFIGKHLINRLIKEGAKVYCIGKIEKEGIKNIDITNYEKLKKIILKINPNIIFHLAALTNPSRDINLVKETFEINTQGTLNLLLATKDIDYEKFIYANTSELYGDENQPPFNENMKVKAMSPYSASKINAEHYCELFSNVFNKPIVTFRMPIVYGPGQKGKMFIPDLMNSIKENKEFSMTKGEQARDFIYIDDIIEAFILCCNKEIKGIFNLGSGREIQIKEVIKLLKRYIININVKFNKPYRENEIWHYYLDISKTKNKLQWEPKINLEEGLKKTLEWWKGNG